MLSAYYYVTAFATWDAQPSNPLSEQLDQSVRESMLAHWPNVSVAEIKVIGDVVCNATSQQLMTAYKASELEASKHTEPSQLEGRCFELSYTAALLEHYGFTNVERPLSFVSEIHGSA